MMDRVLTGYSSSACSDYSDVRAALKKNKVWKWRMFAFKLNRTSKGCHT